MGLLVRFSHSFFHLYQEETALCSSRGKPCMGVLLMLGFLKTVFLKTFLYALTILLMMLFVMLPCALYCKVKLVSDLWEQLYLASECKSDGRDTVDWSRKWLINFNAGKTQPVSFHCSFNSGAIDVKKGWFCSS